jgi:hypothetical protein
MKQTSLNYIKAKTPEGLKQLCLKNSVTRGYYFKYDVIFDGKNWFAWYEEDASDMIQSEIKTKEVNDASNK